MPPNGAVPEPLILSSEVLEIGGVYLLDNGSDLLLYVDQELSEPLTQVRGGRGCSCGITLLGNAAVRCNSTELTPWPLAQFQTAAVCVANSTH
jgi:hypothetical protein